MTACDTRRAVRAGVMLSLLLLAGCARAPSFDILGSYFPAWLLCLTLGLLFTVVTRWLLHRLQIQVAAPIVVYPSLLAVFTFALWLALFR